MYMYKMDEIREIIEKVNDKIVQHKKKYENKK